jgi:hypothetical protein
LTTALAENPVCDNTEEYRIYETGCYSFGDEFVFVSKNWPEYENGEEKPEEGTTFVISAWRGYGTLALGGCHQRNRQALCESACLHCEIPDRVGDDDAIFNVRPYDHLI